MNQFRRPGAGVQSELDAGADPDELLPAGPAAHPRSMRPTFTDLTHRVSRWFQGLDAEPEDGETAEWDPLSQFEEEDDRLEEERAGRLQEHRRFQEPGRFQEHGRFEEHRRFEEPGRFDDGDVAPRFPLAPFGYNRVAVDEQLAELEHRLQAGEAELMELRAAERPPLSITEEIERIGEQTASILVVAHDQAHETTRRAEEQAERCIADAAANAVSITSEAKQRLRELDEETDAVWRERERLLEDARTVSLRLATLVDDAAARFPADPERTAFGGPGAAFPSVDIAALASEPRAMGGAASADEPMALDDPPEFDGPPASGDGPAA